MSAQGLGSRAILGRLFQQLEQGGVGWVNQLSLFIDSDQESETHKWIGMAPQMREWLGGREASGFREQGITIRNTDYEATIQVLLRELRRDKTGLIRRRIDDLAERANSHGASLLSTLMINAESATCYDGQFFFDTDHSEGDSGSQSNDIAVDISALSVSQHGSTTDPSADEMAFVILKAINQMFTFKDDKGEPLNENARNFMVMMPPALWVASADALKSPNLSAGRSNPLASVGYQITPVANPRLTWTTKLAAFRTDGNVRPFIHQEEVPLMASAMAEGSPEEYHNKRHLYSVDWTGAFGYGFWQGGVLATMT